MEIVMERIVSFLVQNFPRADEVALWGGPFFLWSWTVLRFAGWLKSRHGARTAYTRKLFHIVTFVAAAAVQYELGVRSMCLFGLATSLVIAIALCRGEGDLSYEAIARESDAPFRSYFIIVPYFATLLGGLASNIVFGEFAIVGYLVAGFGDVVGEPIGARFGRHRYHPPGSEGQFTRSFEGSAAVLIVSGASAGAALSLLGSPLAMTTVLAVVVIGTASALLEAISPHGWDNTPMQVAPPLIAWALLVP